MSLDNHRSNRKTPISNTAQTSKHNDTASASILEVGDCVCTLKPGLRVEVSFRDGLLREPLGP